MNIPLVFHFLTNALMDCKQNYKIVKNMKRTYRVVPLTVGATKAPTTTEFRL